MTCYNPRTAYPIEGGIAFEKPHGHSGRNIKIPCRNCLGCDLLHKNEWSIRGMHETQMHTESGRGSVFVTLTISDQNRAANMNLDQTLFQKFMRRLRKYMAPQKLRFMACAEYGGNTQREHFHAIIWGLELPDLIHHSTNDRGEALYSSKILDEIWSHGFTLSGAVTQQSCAYVAGYMHRDSKNQNRPIYETIDVATGEVTGRTKPFARYSNRPGIGKSWFDKYHGDVFPCDSWRDITGRISPVPQYYFNLLEKLDPTMHAKIKLSRLECSFDPKIRAERMPQRLASKETCKRAQLSFFGRRGTEHETPETTLYINSEESK